MNTLAIAFLYFFVIFDICLNIILIGLDIKKEKAKKKEAIKNEKE